MRLVYWLDFHSPILTGIHHVIMNCPNCHEPELSMLGRSLRFRDGGTVVVLDYLCPRFQIRWQRWGETGLKIEERNNHL